MKDEPRHFVVNGRRWRKTDPRIPETLQKELVKELMAARRAVGVALKSADEEAERLARQRVQDAKVALGERGRGWWLPPEQSATDERLAAAMRALLRKRGTSKSICPSDAARVADGDNWRELMPRAREVASQLAEAGWLVITQNGEEWRPGDGGPIRLRRRVDKPC